MTATGWHRVASVYVVLSGAFTLAASMIWAINTVFMMREGGLTLMQVMLVNAVFTLAQMVFEVPTGVVADTVGRKASILLSMATLMVSTIAYAITPMMGWGMAGFAVASLFIALGFTFQTGAVDAWLVDALGALGREGGNDRIFARGQAAAGAGMLVGSLAGGVLGQFGLVVPYIARAVLIAVCGVVVVWGVADTGFERRPLMWSTFAGESRAIMDAGVTYGWRSRVVRPLMWTSAIAGLFYMYGFYAWQPYLLELAAAPGSLWLLGLVQAGFSAASIAGNLGVARLMRDRVGADASARVLARAAVLSAALVAGIALVGWRAQDAPGVGPAALAATLWIAFGAVFGITGPVRMSYINAHIPSAQRATVLSLDALFADGGGAVGQPALGWVSDRVTAPLAWAIGATCVAASAPLYAKSGRGAKASEER